VVSNHSEKSKAALLFALCLHRTLPLKAGSPVISDRALDRGAIELKDRSAGGWRSGLQRSEK
jgi:hypothetical protein